MSLRSVQRILEVRPRIVRSPVDICWGQRHYQWPPFIALAMIGLTPGTADQWSNFTSDVACGFRRGDFNVLAEWIAMHMLSTGLPTRNWWGAQDRGTAARLYSSFHLIEQPIDAFW